MMLNRIQIASQWMLEKKDGRVLIIVELEFKYEANAATNGPRWGH